MLSIPSTCDARDYSPFRIIPPQESPTQTARRLIMGVTTELSAIITEMTFGVLDAICVRRAKQAIKDGIAVAVAGARELPVRLLASHAKALGGARQASLWGHGLKSSTVHAAYVNGAATHVLDFEPMWLPPTHAVSPVLPVAL